MPPCTRLARVTLAVVSALVAWAPPARAQEPQAPAAAPVPAAPLVRDGVYVIQPGDEITIKVFRQPELEETTRVRPDGRISAMLLDEVVAAGATTQELDARLTARYAQFFKEPEVTVIVRQFATMKVFVGGEVGQPGTVPIVGDLSAVAAIFQAGGFRSSARMDSVILLRNGGASTLVQRLNLKDVLTKGKPDVALKPYDVIYVPVSRIAKADRFIDQYVRQLLPISLTAGFSYLLNRGTVILPGQ